MTSKKPYDEEQSLKKVQSGDNLRLVEPPSTEAQPRGSVDALHADSARADFFQADSAGLDASDQPSETTDKLDPRVGEILAGRLKLVRLLGTGGMSSVYLATDLNLNREVAVKILSEKRVEHTDSLRRFDVEAKATSKITHPNIVKIFEYGVHGDYPYLTMEYLPGQTLAQYLNEKRTLSVSRTIELALQVCEALAEAHRQKVVHRDLKPSNIMLVANDISQVKIVDFGIAKMISDTTGQSDTKTGEILGSPLYMSPEQCSGLRVDRRSDIYSLGCILYECLTGQPPLFASTSIGTVTKHLHEKPLTLKEATLGGEFPEELEAIIAKMLEKKPDDRHRFVEELQSDLESVGKKGHRYDNPWANGATPPGTDFLNDLRAANLRNLQPIELKKIPEGPIDKFVDSVLQPNVVGALVVIAILAVLAVPTIFFYVMENPKATDRKLTNTYDKVVMQKANQETKKWTTMQKQLDREAIDENDKKLRQIRIDDPHATNIRAVSLQCSSQGWAVLKDCKDLKCLNLDGSNITDKDLVNLRSLPIQILDLSDCDQLGGDGIRQIGDLSNLRKLSLREMNLAYMDLSQLNSNLEELDLSDNPSLRYDTIETLLPIRKLKRLDLSDATELDSRAIPVLSKMKNLRYLCLTGCNRLTSGNIATLRRNLPECLIEYFAE